MLYLSMTFYYELSRYEHQIIHEMIVFNYIPTIFDISSQIVDKVSQNAELLSIMHKPPLIICTFKIL